MKQTICDICGKEITPADIHINLNVTIENKIETLDMHSLCFMHFKRAIKEIVNDDTRCD